MNQITYFSFSFTVMFCFDCGIEAHTARLYTKHNVLIQLRMYVYLLLFVKCTYLFFFLFGCVGIFLIKYKKGNISNVSLGSFLKKR